MFRKSWFTFKNKKNVLEKYKTAKYWHLKLSPPNPTLNLTPAPNQAQTLIPNGNAVLTYIQTVLLQYLCSPLSLWNMLYNKDFPKVSSQVKKITSCRSAQNTVRRLFYGSSSRNRITHKISTCPKIGKKVILNTVCFFFSRGQKN